MPNVYEITDPDSGKTYRMEADDGVSQEEALADFESLGRDNWADFEYKPQQQEAAPVEQVKEPSPVRVPTPNTATEPAVKPKEYPVRIPMDSTNLPEAETYTVAEGALFNDDPVNPLRQDAAAKTSVLAQMIGDDKYTEQEIRDYAKSTGYNFEGLDENLKARSEGKAVTKDIGLDPEWMNMIGQVDDPGLEQGDRTGTERMLDAYKDATQYGFPGWLARKSNDWFDTSKDTIREAFPGRSEEWYEDMHDYAINKTQRALREEGRLRQEQDPNWRPDESWLQNTLAIERWGPWFLGTMGGSAGPEMAVAPGASLAARATAQAGLGAVSDFGYQAADIADNIEDEFSVESLALNALMGAGGEAAITGVARTVGLDSARGKGVNSTEVRNARFPRVMEPLDQTIPYRTTTDKRTTAYKTETAAAQQSISDRVNVITQDWSNAPEFEVHGSFEGIKDLDNDGLGVYRSDGKVLLNTDRILNYAEKKGVSPDDVVRSVVFHEALGHHGLASRYGDDLDLMMQNFYQQGDADFRQRVQNYMEVTGETDEILATEETLAILSERGEMPVRMMDRLVTFFRGWAREIPWVGQNLKYTDNEIRTLLGIAQRETSQGAPTQGGGDSDKYMVVYHGSGADFDRFDHSFMSSGEGAQVYGWGTYLSESKGVARSYRDTMGRQVIKWRGVESPGTSSYATRNVVLNDLSKHVDPEDRMAGAYYEGANAMYNDLVHGGGYRDITDLGEYYDDNTNMWINGRYSPEDRDAFAKGFKPIHDDLMENLKTESLGKFYEVEIPDNARFVEWEETLDNQPALMNAIEDEGNMRVTDYPTWNLIQREAAEARLEYSKVNQRMEDLDAMIKEATETGGLDLTGYKDGEFIPVDVEEIRQWEMEAEEAFLELQELSIKRNKAIERAKLYLHEDMTGGDVYQTIAANTNPKEASEFFKNLGFEGNRYLIDNFRKGQSRKGDGSDRFNYVMFSDETPIIKNKYMKPRDLQDTTPLTPDELSAEELFDSMNAYDILKRITPDGERTVYNMEDLQNDAAARGISPSALLKKATEGEGSLSKSLFMYDLAAQKMNERVTNLYSKIQSGNYTMKDKDNYLKTILQFEDLTAKIFDQQSEVGRALRAIQEMQFTRNRVTTLRDTLRGLDTGLEGLDDPATFEKFARAIDEQMRAASEKNAKLSNPVIQALNVPRAIMSSMDLSAPLRQGLFFITKPAYWKAALDMHGAFASQGKYDSMMTNVNTRPTYGAMVKANLAFSRIDEGAPLSAREEDFQTDLAAEIPIIGRGVKASNRAYSGFRNQLSADMFDHYFEMMSKAGVNVGKVEPDANGKMQWSGDAEATKNIQGMASFINAATGRGNLPEWLRSAGPQLNSIFFSPRLIMSRMNLLNPVFYYKLPPVVRREAIIQAAAMGSLAALTLGAIDHFIPEAEVESDWRHTDFGKVRVGNTRFDVLGGFAQFLRLGARLGTGRMISSTDRVSEYKAAPFIQGIHEGLRDLYEYSTGEVVAPADPTNPAYAQTLKDSISQFLENKFAPNASYINDMLKGEDFIGEEFDPVDGALSRIMPMYFQDMAELASEDGPGTVGTGIGLVASLYGVGSNTYVSKSLDPKQKLEAPDTMEDKNLDDGENEWVTVKDGTITLKPEAKTMYENRLNTYFSEIMEYEMKQQKWSEIERKTQAKIIKDAENEAKREARKDMRKMFGVD